MQVQGEMLKKKVEDNGELVAEGNITLPGDTKVNRNKDIIQSCCIF